MNDLAGHASATSYFTSHACSTFSGIGKTKAQMETILAQFAAELYNLNLTKEDFLDEMMDSVKYQGWNPADFLANLMTVSEAKASDLLILGMVFVVRGAKVSTLKVQLNPCTTGPGMVIRKMLDHYKVMDKPGTSATKAFTVTLPRIAEIVSSNLLMAIQSGTIVPAECLLKVGTVGTLRQGFAPSGLSQVEMAPGVFDLFRKFWILYGTASSFVLVPIARKKAIDKVDDADIVTAVSRQASFFDIKSSSNFITAEEKRKATLALNLNSVGAVVTIRAEIAKVQRWFGTKWAIADGAC